MKYFIVVGEASGDLHASALMKAIKKADKSADFQFFGGDLMQNEGGKLIKHYRDLAYMGIVPVLLHSHTIIKNIELCKQSISLYFPDVVILVDYPGFNLRIAKYVHSRLHLPVYYYISPKLWAWKKWRIKSLKKYVDKMLCILPFEVDFYHSLHYNVEYVGNPTVEEVNKRNFRKESFDDFTAAHQLDNKPIIALLAGSRKQEIKDNLPTMLNVAGGFDTFQAVIAGAPGIETSYYRKYTEGRGVSVVYGETYRLLQHSFSALVTSGTATLETALLRVPQVVCYKTPVPVLVSFIFNNFFSVKYISLVNLIAGKPIVKEFFAKSFSEKAIRKEIDKIINNQDYRDRMISEYENIIKVLGDESASQKAAIFIVSSLQGPQYY